MRLFCMVGVLSIYAGDVEGSVFLHDDDPRVLVIEDRFVTERGFGERAHERVAGIAEDVGFGIEGEAGLGTPAAAMPVVGMDLLSRRSGVLVG